MGPSGVMAFFSDLRGGGYGSSMVLLPIDDLLDEVVWYRLLVAGLGRRVLTR